MAAKPPYDIRLVVNKKNEYDRGEKSETFTAYVVYMVEPDPKPYNEHDAGVRNPSLTAFERELQPLGDLGITAYRRPTLADNAWYGYELEYHQPYRVNLRQLEFMVKFMRKVNAKLTKLEEQWGRPEDLAAYCARAVQVVGGKQPFGIYHEKLRMNGTHYEWVDVDGLRSWLSKED